MERESTRRPSEAWFRGGFMDAKYHEIVTRKVLGRFFDEAALEEVLVANLGQDSLWGMRALKPRLHFDNSLIAEGLAYVEQQHARIAELARTSGSEGEQRAALGRLCHSVQDYYAHTNYVDLWLETHGGSAQTSPEEIDPLSEAIANHPDLRSGHFVPWRDWIFHVPLLGSLVRRWYAPEGSHEAMNLDSPERGPGFAYALAAAARRTLHEYQRAARSVQAAGAVEALARFHHAREGVEEHGS